MDNLRNFYINGEWVRPISTAVLDVINPSTEQTFATVAMGGPDDVDHAVAAARAAFPAFSRTSREERVALLERLLAAYEKRADAVAAALSQEMGAPITMARNMQTAVGIGVLRATLAALRTYPFEEMHGSTLIAREPIGVCGLITPWNWPLNQIMCKVAPALAAGCTVVLKPSEVAPLNAILFAEAVHEAGLPPGVFNLVNGDGPGVGAVMSAHPDIDMMSFTGSTRAGILVAKAAADTVKRVSQELGGKSANILLSSVDFPSAVNKGLAALMNNSGQSCNAPTRMFVPADRLDEVSAIVKEAIPAYTVGSPSDPATKLGPVVSQVQYDKIQALIQAGIDEGATLLAGGPGRPTNLNRGFYVQPTVFTNVTPGMTIAREEIFGPVLSILPYRDEEDAIELANDTVYGLAAYVQSGDLDQARRVASRLKAGHVSINYPTPDPSAPFGGYKQSGNGRERGLFGIEDFLEVKAVIGYQAA